ncbi:hypothetical protein GWI33_005274 [Rhynchophorus ferrugineus]|uniref:Uncharacterized protein n=1 Tax=Rhynchophorus ferrugineus TaxID=354439 RepID=A0A834MJQ7_RHYFE|nr:hypothetical protein GWI33_005274 [Rhynchophorus ferrugineus]
MQPNRQTAVIRPEIPSTSSATSPIPIHGIHNREQPVGDKKTALEQNSPSQSRKSRSGNNSALHRASFPYKAGETNLGGGDVIAEPDTRCENYVKNGHAKSLFTGPDRLGVRYTMTLKNSE